MMQRSMPISPVHDMVKTLRARGLPSKTRIPAVQSYDHANEIANDPSVYPHIKGELERPIDLAEVMSQPGRVWIEGEHGGVALHPLTPGIYSAHPLVLPSGRGEWAKTFGEAFMLVMFARHDALELIGEAPKINRKAIAYAKSINFINELECNGKVVHSAVLQSWAKVSPSIEHRGAWVEQLLSAIGMKLTAKDEPSAHRYVGLAFEMFLNGQVEKGVVFLTRWTSIAGYRAPVMVSERAVEFEGGTVVFGPHGLFHVMGGEPGAALL